MGQFINDLQKFPPTEDKPDKKVVEELHDIVTPHSESAISRIGPAGTYPEDHDERDRGSFLPRR
jgi:hypothetical protein